MSTTFAARPTTHASSSSPRVREAASSPRVREAAQPEVRAGRPAAVDRPHRVHLTRRGRLVVVGGLVLLLLGAFAIGRSADAAPETAASAPQVTRTTVMPGETLWGVAQRIAPGRDPRDVVAQLRRLNDMKTGQLQAGQQLLLPAVA